MESSGKALLRIGVILTGLACPMAAGQSTLPSEAALPSDAAMSAAEIAAQAARAARDQRLAADRVELEKLVAAVDAYGKLDEFAVVASALLDARPGVDKEAERFVRLPDDSSFIDVSLERWVGWNVKAPGADEFPSVAKGREHHPFHCIVDFHRQLAAHGIELLVVTFPMRPHLYPELAPGLAATFAKEDGFAGLCPGTSRFALELNKQGVEILYLASQFVPRRFGGADGEPPDRADQLFLRNNQHWTPRAAELAASLVAKRVRQFANFTPGKAKEGVDFNVKPIEKDVTIVWGGTAEWAKPERLKLVQVTSADAKRRLLNQLPSSPIVVLGDSFADYHRQDGGDFTTHLYRFLEQPIDLLNPRGGVEKACRDSLRRRGDALKADKIIIWLLPEQVFQTGSQWEPLEMFGQ